MNWNLLFLFLFFAEASLNGPAKGGLTDETKADFNAPAEMSETDPVIEPESTLSSFVKRPKIDNGTCPDEETAILCDGFCYVEYLECKENCDTANCERTCLSEYTRCYDSCPCFADCPNGCEGCANSICTCSSPQTNNSFYKQCIKEASQGLNDCIGNCTANETCFEDCFDDFLMVSRKCPCLTECEKGCPCEDGFHCQEYVLGMCQERGTNSNPVNYTYVMSADGYFIENRHFLSPQSSGETSYYPFLYRAASALLNGEIYFFGGDHDAYKIGKLKECEIIDTRKRLVNGQTVYSQYASIITVPEVRDEVVICRGSSSACQSFDGETAKAIASTAASHNYACMALYGGQPLIVAGSATNTVESLELSGWIQEPVHPSGMLRYHACVTVEDGVITTGGYDGSEYLKSVHLFRNEQWTLVGQMSNTFAYGSMIAVEGAFLVYDGYTTNMVERAEWNGETVVSTRNITNLGGNCHRPILFLTEPDYCSDFCSDHFCYV
ncbi:Oidioi.mRNA.OKI2018_I69.chr1.g1897.t1.cds [Oikopleura dioica]|uniref:Oidioi.mRNA.OKI2018_I69.chr1.g1897.t1.cds n=1 Tax=Oikopleura dioica TaxID=34765 RepID=A0ABN7SR11_OIKDI|nr:Oidioi.mRNA.OKI2018_I69.chr1.g1897.t1.cds [Oikopleura dioica]